jgi:hypothetical protein
MADEQQHQSRTRSGAVKPADLKKQIFEIISKDKTIIELITEAVSTCIAQSITENENFVGNVSTKLSSLTDFKASIARAISEDVKQQVYESLSFDVSSANEKIEELKSLQRNLADQCGKLHDNLDELEQYGRRNCLIIHGVPEKQDENTDNEVLNIFNNKLQINVKAEDLDRSHRLGRNRQVSSRPRPIIVKFARYNKRTEVFRSKKKLKASGVSISESLTIKRYDLYMAAQKHPLIKSTWTLDGRIICLLTNNKKIVVQTKIDLQKIVL